MRVLIASNSIGLWRGGHTRNIMYLAKYLQKRGVDIEIFTANIMDQDVVKMNLPITRAAITTYSLPKFARRLADHMTSKQYDVLHSNGPVAYAYLTQEKSSHVPTFFHARSSNLSNAFAAATDTYLLRKPKLIKNALGSLYEFRFDLIAMKYCNHIFANCYDTLNRLDRVISIRQKASVLHNGIADLPKVREQQASCANLKSWKTPNNLVVGYLANNHLVKGWKYLVDIIKVTVAKSNNIKFKLAGDGPLHQLIKGDLHEQISKGQVTLFDRIENSDTKEKFFNSLDLFVCPAHAPTTVLESLTHQVPVIWFSRWQDCANGIDVDPFVDMGWITRYQNLPPELAAKILLSFKPSCLPLDTLYSHIIEEYSWDRIAEHAMSKYYQTLK